MKISVADVFKGELSSLYDPNRSTSFVVSQDCYNLDPAQVEWIRREISDWISRFVEETGCLIEEGPKFEIKSDSIENYVFNIKVIAYGGLVFMPNSDQEFVTGISGQLKKLLATKMMELESWPIPERPRENALFANGFQFTKRIVASNFLGRRDHYEWTPEDLEIWRNEKHVIQAAINEIIFYFSIRLQSIYPLLEISDYSPETVFLLNFEWTADAANGFTKIGFLIAKYLKEIFHKSYCELKDVK
jgi:hypothetical protein